MSPITDKQRERRKEHLGSSDMASVLGLDPYKNAYDLWLLKTGRVDDSHDDSAAMKRGRYMEYALIAFAEDELGELEKDGEKLEFVEGLFIDHPDAIVKATGEPVEAKHQDESVLRMAEDKREFWGDSDSDKMPDRVIIQSHIHMICTHKQLCHVPVKLPFREFEMFSCKYDGEISQMLFDSAGSFMELVKKDTPPEKITPSLAIIKKAVREASIVKLDDSVAEEYQKCVALTKALDQRSKAVQAKILADMYDKVTGKYVEVGQFSGGQITYFAQQEERLDIKRLRAEKPEIASEYVKVTQKRVMRIKGGK